MDKTRLGMWIAGGGTALQLVGLSWDAVLHRLDPELAAREGPLTLANPSHLFIFLGLALSAGGVGLALYTSSTPPRSNGLIGLGRLAAVGLVLLVSVTGGIAVATGGLPSGHSHSVSATTTSASPEALPWSDPVFVRLAERLREQGSEAALDELQTMAASSPAVLSDAHNYAHALGRFSFSYYGGARAAFDHCRETFQSGCYHGVIEEYFLTSKNVGPEQVAALCDREVQASTTYFVRFQCVHGLGHGLAMFLGHDLNKVLTFCDYLQTDWDRQSCYGGAFMENVVFAQSAGQEGHSHAGHAAFVKADDALYPCDAVGARYREQCYLMQTSVMLMFNGYDFGKAAASCARAPSEFVATCFKSLGRDISGTTLRDTARSLDLCGQGPSGYQVFCFVGVVKNFIDVTWTIDQALEFCARVPNGAKAPCYQAIGEQVAGIYADPGQRREQCDRVEPGYIHACGAGAQIRG